MGLLNRIIVEDVLLHDRKNQEMLKVARLSAKFDLLPLLNGKVTISSVQLLIYGQFEPGNSRICP